MLKFTSYLLLNLLFLLPLSAQANILKASASTIATYKKISDTELKAYIFNPPKHKASDKKAAIIFFFGGGWNKGTPAQFTKHCEYLAARGIVAITADYRVFERQGALISDCIADAKSAIRWLRQEADSLGIDADKIVGAGGSSGGHLAMSAGLLSGFDDAQDDLSVSCVPNAYVLFNPPLVLSPTEKGEFSEHAINQLRTRFGIEPSTVSPYHHIKKGMGPTIIFHGEQDMTCFVIFSNYFTDVMRQHNNDCQLVIYEGEPHGFFNYGRNNNGPFIDTVKRMDDFLVKLGYLPAVPKASER